jgi:transcriptional regulator with XRE-family HTH domain
VRNLLIKLGKRVHELRAAKDWSQEEFAHVSGLHRTYIGQIERGEKNISFGNLSKISSVLGVTLSELLSGLEAGDKLTVKSSQGSKDGGQRMKIQKLVRQLRVQQAAADRAVASLEELVLSSGPANPSATRRHKPGSVKSK